MKRHSRHTAKNVERGSVLMETILVIPLFIAFFSGIFVLGDLMLGRNRLTAADRFAVWLAGCRFADMDDGEIKSAASDSFFGSGAFADGTRLQSFKSKKERVNWYALVRGTGELKITLPVWAAGSRKSAIYILADIGTRPDTELWDNVSFKARDTGGEDAHSVVMRVNYDVREKSGRELAVGGPRWNTEYLTAYLTREGSPTDRPRTQSGVCEGTPYNRYPMYDNWSK